MDSNGIFPEIYQALEELPDKCPHFLRESVDLKDDPLEGELCFKPQPGDLFKYWYRVDGVEVDVELAAEKEVVYLGFICIRKNCNRGKGYGNQCMYEICQWADECGFPIELTAVPIQSEMSYDTLVEWYKSWGFLTTDNKDGSLRRDPVNSTLIERYL